MQGCDNIFIYFPGDQSSRLRDLSGYTYKQRTYYFIHRIGIAGGVHYNYISIQIPKLLTKIRTVSFNRLYLSAVSPKVPA